MILATGKSPRGTTNLSGSHIEAVASINNFMMKGINKAQDKEPETKSQQQKREALEQEEAEELRQDHIFEREKERKMMKKYNREDI